LKHTAAAYSDTTVAPHEYFDQTPSLVLASSEFSQQGFEQLGIHTKVRVAQSVKRFFEIREAAAVAVGQHA
jgi:hypothetical protein